MKDSRDESDEFPQPYPPYSKLFILHGKNATKEELQEAFEKFGTILDIWMIRDRMSREFKGISYIQYGLMSEAALAVEEMNGVAIPSHPRPLKVAIASSREEGHRKDDDLSRFMRLFIVVPKDDEEDENTLQYYFQTFGEVESVKILRYRGTNESKGFAYVTFNRMYSAAKALENCDPKYKAVLARPNDKREQNNYHKPSSRDYNERPSRDFNERPSRDFNERPSRDFNERPSRDYNERPSSRDYNERPSSRDYNDRSSSRDYSDRPSSRDYNERHSNSHSSSRPADLCENYATDQGYTRVCAFISSELSEDLALKLFDLVPGLAYARLTDDVISPRTQKMLLEYDTPEAAAFAVDKLNGFEYPVGEPIMLKPDVEWKQSSSQRSHAAKSGPSERKRDHSGQPARTTVSTKSNYCSAKLPPVQPPVTGEEGDYRLFVVFQPEAPPMAALRDVFCRFGDFVDIHLNPGKHFGYAYYVSEEAAHRAIQVLHGEELLGNRMKVMEAEPKSAAKRSRYE